MEQLPLWAQAILLLLGSSGVSALFNYFSNNRKHKRDDFSEVMRIFREDNETLREEKRLRDKLIADHTKRLAEMERIIQSLQNKIVIFESSHFDLPLPMWLKSTEGTMLSVNSMYEEIFLIPRGYSMSDYIGEKDDSVWPEDVVRAFKINDDRVLRTKRKWIGRELIASADGEREEWTVIKYARKSGNVVIGIGGIAFRKADI